MALSKGKRFDVFKRDGFTCQYCGQRPPDVVLEVDHIHPISKGGTDDDLNLITACYNCNRGKRAKVLSDVGPKPDADLEYLAVQQELKEVQRYLKAKKARDKAVENVCHALDETWNNYMPNADLPTDSVWMRWLHRFEPEEIEEAIKSCAGKYASGAIRGGFSGLVRYVAGTLKYIHEENQCA
jgi:hypothetical protein